MKEEERLERQEPSRRTQGLRLRGEEAEESESRRSSEDTCATRFLSLNPRLTRSLSFSLASLALSLHAAYGSRPSLLPLLPLSLARRFPCKSGVRRSTNTRSSFSLCLPPWVSRRLRSSGTRGADAAPGGKKRSRREPGEGAAATAGCRPQFSLLVDVSVQRE